MSGSIIDEATKSINDQKIHLLHNNVRYNRIEINEFCKSYPTHKASQVT